MDDWVMQKVQINAILNLHEVQASEKTILGMMSILRWEVKL